MRILIILGLIITQVAFAKPIINIQNWVTNDGVTVLFTETHEIPMIDIVVTFDAGSARDGNNFGLAVFTNAMLNSGTKTLTANQIADEFEQNGAQFSTNTSLDSNYIALRCLTEGEILHNAITTFTEVLTNAVFPQFEFNVIKNQILTEIQANQQDPSIIASEEFFRQLYEDFPYAHSISGNEKTIAALQPIDLIKFYQTYYTAANASIVIIGDVTRQQAEDIANKITSRLPKGTKAAPLPEVVKNPKAEIHIDYPTAQTTALIGQIGIARSDEDYLPLYVGNCILGDGFVYNTLLGQEVRLKNGLVYGIYSWFNTLVKPGPFKIFFSSNNEKFKEALAITTQTLKNFIQNGPTIEVFEATKNGLIANFPLGFASNAAVRDKLIDLKIYNLPLNYYDTYIDNLKTVTIEQVHTAFKEHINPENMTTVTVGQKV